MQKIKLDEIVSLAKRRGFIFAGSDIYGGLSGTWDYGPLGIMLKRNIVNLWWNFFIDQRSDMFPMDAAILMNSKVWQASGHVDTFTDPLVECRDCHNRFRADKISLDKCPNCGKLDTFTSPRNFNLMLSTTIGPASFADNIYEIDRELLQNKLSQESQEPFLKLLGNEMNIVQQNNLVYLRPETAQGIFVNYKNIVDTFYPDLPFGIAQHGKAFRNEISPRDFIFRSREFEQLEIEYFVDPANWQVSFEMWLELIREWCLKLGLPTDMIHEHEIDQNDRAHYSQRTVDFEFDFPIGQEELLGLAYRTDFDLKNIERATNKSMAYRTKDGKAIFTPHVIEPSFGVERAIMAVLSAAYKTDDIAGETRNYLRLPHYLSPYLMVVGPLAKNKPELVDKAKTIYRQLKKKFGSVMWDDNSNIGKRYRRADEIGTPFCLTIDFDSLSDNSLTIRDRDTTKQTRVHIEELEQYIKDAIK